MKNLILIIFIALNFVGFGQDNTSFNYSDTTFIVGQTKRMAELRMGFSHPIYTDPKNDSIIDSIFVFLKANPTIKIEIQSHTDT